MAHGSKTCQDVVIEVVESPSCSSMSELSLCEEKAQVTNVEESPCDSSDEQPPPRRGIKRAETLRTFSRRPLTTTYETALGTYHFCNNFLHEKAVKLLPKTLVRRLDYLGRYTNGWRFGVIASALAVVIVLVLNVSYAVWVAARRGYSDGYGIIADGDCHYVRHYNSVAHLAINIFSTILLSGSNYTMQCLCAPSREEVDKAHANHRSIDVGTQSLTNLRCISRWKVAAWVALSLSSLPLHLFYNSVMFTSISANDYVILGVDKSFLEPSANMIIDKRHLYGTNYPVKSNPYFSNSAQPVGGTKQSLLELAQNMRQGALAGHFERLGEFECLQQYAHNFLSTRSNLIMVASGSYPGPQNSSILSAYAGRISTARGATHPDTFSWICGQHKAPGSCSTFIPGITSHQPHWTPWTPFNFKVAYCLSQPSKENCRLQISSRIVTVVAVFNLFKAAIMCTLAFGLTSTPLITIGDAVASFVTRRDRQTRGSCMASKLDFKKTQQRRQQWEPSPCGTVVKAPGRGWGGYASEWKSYRPFWYQATHWSRWVIFMAYFWIGMAIVVFWFDLGLGSLHSKAFSYWWPLGIGNVRPETILTTAGVPTAGTPALLSNLVLSNCGQPLLSVLYMAYNGLLTNMVSELEWSNYAYRKEGLRVSVFPKGEQRMTYFLQLPFRYGFPLMAFSATLHWLVSQSVFLVALEIHTPHGQPASVARGLCRPGDQNCIANTVWMSTGWSPAATFLAIIVGSVMFVSLGIGLKRYKPGMPLAGNQTAVISAACHMSIHERGVTEEGSETAAFEALQWGVVQADDGRRTHCAFSTGKPSFPDKGLMYQ